jgi:hypothetical protein
MELLGVSQNTGLHRAFENISYDDIPECMVEHQSCWITITPTEYRLPIDYEYSMPKQL